MLGLRLPAALLQTSDVDIAQFTNISVAMGDHTPPMLEILKVVDFVTPNEGPDTDDPQNLPAFQTAAQPLRFLDFLIHEPVQAVVLSGPGIHVQVPSPERFAVHKLIVSRRRPAGVAKADKDVRQAAVLIEALAEQRPHELKAVWEEACARGPTWRRLVLEGMTQLSPRARDLCLKVMGRNREILPGIDLIFSNSPVRYDTNRDVIKFSGEALGNSVDCEVSRETLEDHFDADNLEKAGRIETFRRHRSRIERLIRKKYLSSPIEEPGVVLLKTLDVETLTRT